MPDCQHPTLKAEPTHPARRFPTQSSALCSRCSVNVSGQVHISGGEGPRPAAARSVQVQGVKRWMLGLLSSSGLRPQA